MTTAQDSAEPDSPDSSQGDVEQVHQDLVERSDGDGPDSDIRIVRESARRRRAERRRRKATSIVSGLTTVFVVLVVALAVAGWRTTLRITGGADEKVTDPNAPGYTAEVRPTEVQLLSLTKESGELATMLLLVGGQGGEPIAVPISAGLVLWEFEDAGPVAAADLFADGGLDVLALRLGVDLSFGVASGATLPISSFDPLFEAMGPIETELPDIVYAVGDGDTRSIRYPAGELTLQPAEVAEFLSFRGRDEAELNRSLRVEPVWEKILAAYQENPELVETTPDVDKGVGLLAEMADKNQSGKNQSDGSNSVDAGSDGNKSDGESSASVIQVLPTKVVSLYTVPPIHLDQIDAESMPAWVSSYVPFPTSAFPGQRAVVNLLNGTATEGASRKVSPLIVSAGGSIGMTGNAGSFDFEQTQVVYANPSAEPRAQKIAAELGARAEQIESLPSGVDVQVTVGQDLL